MLLTNEQTERQGEQHNEFDKRCSETKEGMPG